MTRTSRLITILLCIVFLGLIALAADGLRSVRYVFILPDDFVGKITVVYHPRGPDRLKISGGTVTMVVPDSGVVVTPDDRIMHHFIRSQEWRYRDGRVIASWQQNQSQKLAPGFAYVGGLGTGGRGIERDDPLFRWAIWDSVSKYYEITELKYEVRRGPVPIDAFTQ